VREVLPAINVTPSASEIADLLTHEDMMPLGKNILRRLVFQRDILLEELDRAESELEQIRINGDC